MLEFEPTEIQIEALVRLDRKVSRALNKGAGIKLTANELDILAMIGVARQLSMATAEALTNKAISRRGTPTGSAASSAADVTDVSSGRRRAQEMFVSTRPLGFNTDL